MQILILVLIGYQKIVPRQPKLALLTCSPASFTYVSMYGCIWVSTVMYVCVYVVHGHYEWKVVNGCPLILIYT